MFGAIPIDARPNEELDKTRAVLQRMTGVPVGAAGESGLKPMMALPTMEECMEAVRRITGLDNLPPAETADRVEAEARARRQERIREMYSRPICDAADNSSDRTTVSVLIAERDSWKERAHKAEELALAAMRGESSYHQALCAALDRARAAEAALRTREASLHRATGARFNPPGSIGGP